MSEDVPDIPVEEAAGDPVVAVDAAEIPAKGNLEEGSDEKNEAMPVLDVHVPHATHTWKDFWIHLGTIAAGLLIAISLEQSVEALHRLHERHVLEESLRSEGEQNRVRTEIDFEQYDSEMIWLLALHQDIETMIATRGKANLLYRPQPALPRG